MFISYFDKKRNLQGMKIDDELGGTTPLNIILNFPKKQRKSKRMMSLMSGRMKITPKRIRQSTGSPEIKWIKY